MGMKTSVNLNGSGNLNGRGSESTEIFVKTLTGKTITLGSGRRAPSNFGLSATMNADEAVSRGVALKIKDPTARAQDDPDGSSRRAPSIFGLSATMNADEAVSRGAALKIKDPTARVQDDQGPKTIPTARVQREIFVKDQQRSSSRR